MRNTGKKMFSVHTFLSRRPFQRTVGLGRELGTLFFAAWGSSVEGDGEILLAQRDVREVCTSSQCSYPGSSWQSDRASGHS